MAVLDLALHVVQDEAATAAWAGRRILNPGGRKLLYLAADEVAKP